MPSAVPVARTFFDASSASDLGLLVLLAEARTRRALREVPIRYTRYPHGVHLGTAGARDVEHWDVEQACDAARPVAVPADAERHSGYLDSDRRQHVLYLRWAPASPCPDCPHCARRPR